MYLHSHKGSANGILLAFALIIHGRLASWLQSVHFLGIISMPFRCPLCFTRSYRCLFMVIFIEYFRINQTYTSSIWKIPLSRCIPLIQFVVVYPIDDGWTMLFNILFILSSGFCYILMLSTDTLMMRRFHESNSIASRSGLTLSHRVHRKDEKFQ